MTRLPALAIARTVLLLGALGHVAGVAGDDNAVSVPAGGLRDSNAEEFRVLLMAAARDQQQATSGGLGQQQVRTSHYMILSLVWRVRCYRSDHKKILYWRQASGSS